MLHRQNFSELPPTDFLMIVLDRTSKLYVYLWSHKDDSNNLHLTWTDITKTHNKNSFRSSLRKLNDFGLLSYHERASDISIELVGWDDVNED